MISLTKPNTTIEINTKDNKEKITHLIETLILHDLFISIDKKDYVYKLNTVNNERILKIKSGYNVYRLANNEIIIVQGVSKTKIKHTKTKEQVILLNENIKIY